MGRPRRRYGLCVRPYGGHTGAPRRLGLPSGGPSSFDAPLRGALGDFEVGCLAACSSPFSAAQRSDGLFLCFPHGFHGHSREMGDPLKMGDPHGYTQTFSCLFSLIASLNFQQDYKINWVCISVGITSEQLSNDRRPKADTPLRSNPKQPTRGPPDPRPRRRAM